MKNLTKYLKNAMYSTLIAVTIATPGCISVKPEPVLDEYKRYEGKLTIVTPLFNGTEEVKYPNGVIEIRPLGYNPTEEDRIRVLNRK
ncbi:MAG: hypothetical protein WC584_03440 [Candidatus Pacearchaeota archaeon]